MNFMSEPMPDSLRISQAIERKLQNKATDEDLAILSTAGATATSSVKMSVVQVHLPSAARTTQAQARPPPFDPRLG